MPDIKGEETEMIKERLEKTIRELLHLFKDQAKSKLVLIGHGGPAIVLGLTLTGKGYTRKTHPEVRAGTCSISKYSRVPGSESSRPGLGIWTQGWNGKSDFLKDGEEVRSPLSSMVVGRELIQFLTAFVVHPYSSSRRVRFVNIWRF